MKTLFPTPYLRFVKATIAPRILVLQQLWAPAGWQGMEPEGDESWRPEGEWRDVPVE